MSENHHDINTPGDVVYHFSAWLKKYWRDLVPVAVIVVVLIGVFTYLSLRNNSTTTPATNLTTNNSSGSGSITAGGGSNTSSTGNASKLWNGSVHGILALEGSQSVPVGYGQNNMPAKLVLLNPSNGNIIAQTSLPDIDLKQNSNGAQFTLVTGGNPDLYDFNATYQYIAVQYDQASDGSQDVGYYNLANGGVVDISPKTSSSFGASVVSDTSPSFDLNNPNLLLFQRNNQSYSYNIATGQSQPYTPPTTPPLGDNPTSTTQFFDEPTPVCSYVVYDLFDTCLLMDSAHAPMIITDQGPGNGGTICGGSQGCGDGIFANSSANATFTPLASMQNSDGNEQESGITCNPVQWLNRNNILCDDLTTEDVGAKVLKPDGDDDGLNYYAVSNPVSLLPSNTRTNNNPVISPDGKTIAFISSLGSSTGLYKVSSSGGQPTQIMGLGNDNSDLKLIAWR